MLDYPDSGVQPQSLFATGQLIDHARVTVGQKGQLRAWLQACTIRVITHPMFLLIALLWTCCSCNMSALLQLTHQFSSNLSHTRMTYSQASAPRAVLRCYLYLQYIQ